MRFLSEARDGGFSPHSVRLAWILAVAYLLVVAYASLQPFQGWRVPPDEIRHFLGATWPHFITLQDVAINVAAYIPFGLLLSIGCGARYGPARGAIIAALAAAAVSLSMEAVQMFLPLRIASNVDLLANGLGGLLGAMAAPLLAPTRVPGVALHAARHRLFLDGIAAEIGVVVVLLWLVTQFHPTVQLFGAGNIRATFDLPAYFTHTPWLAFSGEAAVAALNLLGVGLMLSALMRDGAHRLLVTGTVIGAALAIKAFTAIVMVQAPASLAWLTPGVMAGLAIGSAFLFAATRLPRPARLATAALCIVAATAAINLAPDNPYQSIPPRLMTSTTSHFLRFSGIVRALSELWPLLATGFLLYALSARRR
jgi:VanZ family protein